MRVVRLGWKTMRIPLMCLQAFLALTALCYSQERDQKTATELIEDLAESRAKSKAIDDLHKLGVSGFPSLFEHFGDERFCMSEDKMSGAPRDRTKNDLSVGIVCRRIVDRQLRHYIGWEDEPDPRWYPGYFTRLIPNENDAAKAWWKSNKSKELWELQADFIDLESIRRDRKPQESKPFRPYSGK
jgi:hypothetical protein